jgi:ABC-type multidrug transport system fused ATPase/permease subunit
MSYYDKRQVGPLISTITDDIHAIQDFASTSLQQLLGLNGLYAELQRLQGTDERSPQPSAARAAPSSGLRSRRQRTRSRVPP